MKKDTLLSLETEVGIEITNPLHELIREGARRMIQAAIEVEVSEYIEKHATVLNEAGHRLVVRNGHMPARQLQSEAGHIRIKQPRINDKRPGKYFTSMILPPYLRRSPSIEALIPALYLKGVSTNEMCNALASILGEQARGLSSGTVTRLKQVWEDDYKEWAQRDLTGKHYVYIWADGIHFNVRLTDERPCMLVIMGALADGTKELVAILDGERESKLSWMELLRDLKRRGMKDAPKIAIGDGALGFWAALEETFPQTRKQRCWVHKTANILDKMPKRTQGYAKELIHDIYLAETKDDAKAAYEEFVERYKTKFPKAVKCLTKDKDVLFTFYDFPAEHWAHLRTTNPIESTFATLRHRHRQTKGCGSRTATLSMVFKLTREAEKGWRKLNGYQLIRKVIEGVIFKDGIQEKAA